MNLKNINNSFLYYNENECYYVKEYYLYIVKLIKNILLNNNLNINIILGNYIYNFNNNNRIVIISINYEHTLVKDGGRDSNNSSFGSIKVINTNNDEYYLVRIVDYDILKNSNIIIDYSIPNIRNIHECNLFNDLYNKYVYVAPLLYQSYTIKDNRNINCLTTFIDIEQHRRKKLLLDIVNNNIKHINVNNCFNTEDLGDLYKKTKIMINIHQTDHHHTFEELRVLPALLNGIIIICEDSPLKESIIYNNFVIWSTYENIINTIIDVQNNYDLYWDKIFNNGINKIIEIMEENNYKDLERQITAN